MKQFIFANKDIFLKSPKDAYLFHQDIIRECIARYNCPDVFNEMEVLQQKTGVEPKIRDTKFYTYWINKNRIAKILVKEPAEMVKTTKEVIKKKLIKDKIVKQEEAIVIERQPVEQTIEFTRVYHKINFNSDIANEYYKFLDLMLKKIRLKASDIFNTYKEYKARLDATENPIEVDKINKKLIAFERLNKMISESFNDGQSFQTQLRMLIENEKQIKEHGFYNKEMEEEGNFKITKEVIESINEKLSDVEFREFVEKNYNINE